MYIDRFYQKNPSNVLIQKKGVTLRDEYTDYKAVSQRMVFFGLFVSLFVFRFVFWFFVFVLYFQERRVVSGWVRRVWNCRPQVIRQPLPAKVLGLQA